MSIVPCHFAFDKATMPRHSTAQHSTAQHSTAQHSTAQVEHEERHSHPSRDNKQWTFDIRVH